MTYYTTVSGGGGGAPADAEYIVAALNPTLTAERVLTNTATVTWDFTAPGAATANVPDDAILNAKLADMAANTVKINNTGVAANPIDGTTAQTTAMLDLFTAALKGLVPLSGGGTTNFLRADATWAPPPGGSGAATWTDFTKDIGAGTGGRFDITGLAGLTPDKNVAIIQTAQPIASKGNSRDELEMDAITLTGYVLNTTTIRAYWSAIGIVVGTYAFAYQVGA